MLGEPTRFFYQLLKVSHKILGWHSRLPRHATIKQVIVTKLKNNKIRFPGLTLHIKTPQYIGAGGT